MASTGTPTYQVPPPRSEDFRTQINHEVASRVAANVDDFMACLYILPNT